MADVLVVANYLNVLYKEKHGCNMRQQTMHRLLYFTQRESLMLHNKPLFPDSFEAWKYGPVLPIVRQEYLSEHLFTVKYHSLTHAEQELVKTVFERYHSFSDWDLCTLSHEFSWKQARTGCNPHEHSKNKLSIHAMKVDAVRESLRRKGVVLA